MMTDGINESCLEYWSRINEQEFSLKYQLYLTGSSLEQTGKGPESEFETVSSLAARGSQAHQAGRKLCNQAGWELCPKSGAPYGCK
jgi:hypothetical protein